MRWNANQAKYMLVFWETSMRNYTDYYETPYAGWFSSLPVTWQTKKMRMLFSERTTKVSDKDYAPLSVGYMGVVPQL